MDFIGGFFGVLEQGLKLWNTKESRKYLEELMDLKGKYYEEKSKKDPDMARLDELEHRLWVLSSAFTSAPGSTAEASSG